MVVCDRLGALREEKNFSLGRHRSARGSAALLHLAVENGYTVATVETLRKMARTLEVQRHAPD
jgi:hypothetical protein